MRFEILPPVPAVTIARRLRDIPLFRFASVDELFRIASISQQVRYDAKASVQERGRKADYIQVLVSGRLRVEPAQGEVKVVEPPAMLGFQEALEGTPVQESVTAETDSIVLVMLADEFRGLLAANIELAEGLFRLLVSEEGDERARLETVGGADGTSGAGAPFVFEHRDKPLGNVDKVMYLQTLPILARATGEEIYEVAAIAREVPFEAGDLLVRAGDPPSILLALSGRLTREGGGGEVSPGTCVGVRETLAGAAWKHDLRATTDGQALKIERESFFDLLGDRMNLLQAIFGAVFDTDRDRDREGGAPREATA